MKIPNNTLRSSSMNSWDFCNHKFLIEYGIGVQGEEKASTIKGSIVHHCAELLARKKLAIQNGEVNFFDTELDKTISVEECTQEFTHKSVFDYYASRYLFLTEGDRRESGRWFNKLLVMENGAFNPMNQNIIAPEQRFTFKVEKDWARIDNDFLTLTGTIDLVTQSNLGPYIYHMIDYKTGKRINWATGEEKNENNLKKDIQLRFYHYAACQLYPDIQEIFVTIVYINDGGSFFVPFGRSELPETENMIRKYFDDIRATRKPRLTETWRCAKFCFKKHASEHDPNKTICKFFADKVNEIGVDAVIDQYKTDRVDTYTGGGKSYESIAVTR